MNAKRIGLLALMVVSLLIASYLSWGMYQKFFEGLFVPSIFLGVVGLVLIEVYVRCRQVTI